MYYESRAWQHLTAALREEDAAIRATCAGSARAHSELAAMHRSEAAKMESVRKTLAPSIAI